MTVILNNHTTIDNVTFVEFKSKNIIITLEDKTTNTIPYEDIMEILDEDNPDNDTNDNW